jgi:hypothetical protein
MINPEDDVIIDLSTSCTQEGAVIKLLGWSRGPLLRKAIKITSSGISEDQMPFIKAADLSLQEQLQDMRGVAQRELIDAAANGESYAVLEAKEAAVHKYQDMIHRAFNYSLDISDELNKKEGSELDLDASMSKDLGVPYITLRSLDKWARKKYGISVLPTFSVNDVSETEADQTADAAQDSRKTLESGNSESLAITFAFLVEAYAAKHKSTLMRDDFRINVSAFAKELSEIIKNATNQDPPRGQGEESIRKRIDEAIRIKDRRLRSR